MLIHKVTHRLALRGGLIVLGAVTASSVGGWVDRPAAVAEAPREGRSRQQDLEAVRGELTVARVQLERADGVMDYSSRYGLAADLAAKIYDVEASRRPS
jgi:hypothetical protein